MRCQQSPEAQLLRGSSADKRAAVPRLDIISLNTYQSLEFRSEKSMGQQSSKGQDEPRTGTCLRLPDETCRKHISDETLMLRFLMVCIEGERTSRNSERMGIELGDCTRRLSELNEECTGLRQIEMSRATQQKCLKDENMALLIKQRQTEQLVRQKELLIASKEQEISSLRIGLQTTNHQKNKSELGDKLILRELENELVAQKNKYGDVVKRMEELEMQLRYAGERESNLAAVAGKAEKQLRGADQEVTRLKNFLIKLEAEYKQASMVAAALSKEKEDVQQSLEDYRRRAAKLEELQVRLKQREAEAASFAREAQMATARIQKLEIELISRQSQLQNLRQSDTDSFKKQFAQLQLKLADLRTAGSSNKDLGEDLAHVIRERDMLNAKVEQLVSELIRLENILTSRPDECKGCDRFAAENGLLQKRLGVMEHCLNERDAELDRLSKRAVAPSSKPNKENSKTSLRELLQSAQSLKGSNERMNRLLAQSTSNNESIVVCQGYQGSWTSPCS